MSQQRPIGIRLRSSTAVYIWVGTTTSGKYSEKKKNALPSVFKAEGNERDSREGQLATHQCRELPGTCARTVQTQSPRLWDATAHLCGTEQHLQSPPSGNRRLCLGEERSRLSVFLSWSLDVVGCPALYLRVCVYVCAERRIFFFP